MKKFIFAMIPSLLLGIISFYIGHQLGYNKGYEIGKEYGRNECQLEFSNRTTESIRSELKDRELSDIPSYLTGTAKVIKKDEGGLFDVKYVYYLEIEMKNNAALATAKDIKINIDFYSKTNTIIDSRKVTFYEYLKPGESKKFTEKTTVPENYERIEFSIVGSSGE